MKTKNITPAKASKKANHTLFKIVKAKKGRWEIHKGVSDYWTRLVARNGRVICSNFGFNTVASALKNIKAVQASA